MYLRNKNRHPDWKGDPSRRTSSVSRTGFDSSTVKREEGFTWGEGYKDKDRVTVVTGLLIPNFRTRKSRDKVIYDGLYDKKRKMKEMVRTG